MCFSGLKEKKFQYKRQSYFSPRSKWEKKYSAMLEGKIPSFLHSSRIREDTAMGMYSMV